MLTMSPAVTVNGIKGAFLGQADDSYILFPDSEDKNLYYALCERPTYLADSKGNPSFNLTWYYGSGIESAGICTMTVALPMPHMTPENTSTFLSAIKGDTSTQKAAKQTFNLCKETDPTKKKELQKALGVDDANLAKKMALYDPKSDYTQFLPGAADFKISPVPFKDGSVTVQSFADDAAYKGQNPNFSTGAIKTTPSLFNSNAAVVTFNLSKLGVGLFWQALGGFPLGAQAPKDYDPTQGGSSIISVVYYVSFDGLLPAATAVVTFDHKITAALKTEQVGHSDGWGHHWTETVQRGKEMNEAITNNTAITVPYSSGADKNDVQKLLTDWAAAQMLDMAKSQLPAVDLSVLNVDTMRSLDETQTQKRTYSLTQAVAIPKYPQAQLPKVDSLVKPEALKNFFNLFDLNATPSVDVALTVAPPNLKYLQARMVDHFVVTAVTYGNYKLLDAAGKQVSSLDYPTSATQQPGVTLTGTFDNRKQDKTVTNYSYLVSYTDGTPSYRANASQKDCNYLDLSSVDLGVLSVTLDPADITWGVLSSVIVTLTYGAWTKTVHFTSASGPMLIAQPMGKALTDALTYQVTSNLTAGAPIKGPSTKVALIRGAATITLPNPLGDMTNTIPFQLAADVAKAMVKADYTFRSSEADRVFTTSLALDQTKDGGVFNWVVPAMGGKGSKLAVTKVRLFTVAAPATPVDLAPAAMTEGTVDPVNQTTITVAADSLSNF